MTSQLRKRSFQPVHRSALYRQQPTCRDTGSAKALAFDQSAPFRSARLPSFMTKNRFRSSTADRPIQRIDLRRVSCFLQRCAAALKCAGRVVRQLLIPRVDLVWASAIRARQIGNSPIAFGRRQRRPHLERLTVLLRAWRCSSQTSSGKAALNAVNPSAAVLRRQADDADACE